MKKKHFNTGLFLFIFLPSLYYVLVVVLPPAHAAGITLTTSDLVPLTISDVLDGQKTTFSRAISLTATGGNVSGLQLSASDLQLTSPTPTATTSPSPTPTATTSPSPTPSTLIDRSNISIPATDLTDGQAKDVRVTVNNVTQPGTYQGTLKFSIPSQKEVGALSVKLMLVISIRPKVMSVLGADTPISIQVVHDQTAVYDFFTGLFLPESFQRVDWIVQLDNQTSAPVKITDVTVVMHGVKNNVVLNSNAVQFFCVSPPKPTPSHYKPTPPPCNLAPNQVTSLDLMINRAMIPPDEYQGTLRFSLENAITPTSIPINLKVRSGPFWPLIVLLVGLLIGFLAQSLTTALALKQTHLYPRYIELENEVKAITDTTAQEDVTTRLKDILVQINSADEKLTEAVVSQALDSIKQRIKDYIHLQTLEVTITQDQVISDDTQNGLVKRINEASEQLKSQDDPTSVESVIKGIEDDWYKAQESLVTPLAEASPGLANNLLTAKDFTAYSNFVSDAHGALTETASDSLMTIGRAIKKDSRLLHSEVVPWLQQLQEKLVGIEGWLRGAFFRYSIVRPFMGFVLVIVLIVIGLQTLYVSTGASFGAAGISDYLGLLLWGFSTKVVQSSIQTVPTLLSPSPSTQTSH